MNQTLFPSRAVLGFALIFSLLLLALQPFQEILLYRRELVLAGEAWRLLTANLVHTNQNHLYLNLAGFWIFILLCGSILRLKILNFSIIFIALFITTALLAGYPSIKWYAGLSGVLYGLFVMSGILLALAGELLTCAGVVALISIKLLAGWWGAADLSTETLIESPILLESHLYGSFGGFLCGLPAIYAHYRSVPEQRP